MEKRIETQADDLLMMLRREKRMSVPQLQKALGVESMLLEKWITIFEANGTVDLIYPANPIDPPYVVIKHDK
ncbi:hypothetical protein ACFLQ2_01380 [archaeon]